MIVGLILGSAWISLISKPAISSAGGVTPKIVQTLSGGTETAVVPNKLIAPDPVQNAALGSSIQMDGDTMIVGAPGTKAVYVFVRNGSTWEFQARLVSDDDLGETMGVSVAVSGNTAVVGLPFVMMDGLNARGAVYVFERTGSNWSLQKTLTCPDGIPLSFRFGTSVAIEGDTLIASNLGAFGQNAHDGAGYVFTRVSGKWVFQTKLVDPLSHPGDQFGYSMAIDGDTMVIGSRFGYRDASLITTGAVCVFVRNQGTWVLQQRLVGSDLFVSAEFGRAVAIEDNTIVVGAPRATIPPNITVGAAYIFKRVATIWTQEQKVSSPVAGGAINYAIAVALSGDRILVGAPGDGFGTSGSQGLVHVYTKQGPVWMPHIKFSAPDGASRDGFGTSVSALGNKFAVGAPGVDGSVNNSGAAYLIMEPTGLLDLKAADDHGVSDSDNITNATTLEFDIDGIRPGATVELLRDGNVVDFKVVKGSATVLSDAPPYSFALYKYSTRQIVDNETSSQSLELPVIVDHILPVVTLDQADTQQDPTLESDVRFHAVFSETSLGFSDDDFTFVGSTADVSQASARIDNSSIVNTVVASGFKSNGQIVKVSTVAGAVTDLAGNLSEASVSSDNSITVDNIRPLPSITKGLGQADPATVVPVNFSVTFDDLVTGFGPEDIVQSGFPGQVTGTVSVSGSGSQYTVTVSDIVADGKFVVIRVRNGGAQDISGNGNWESTTSSILVDNVAPSPKIDQYFSQSDPASTQPIRFSLQFSEKITDFQASDISLAGSTADISLAQVTLTGSNENWVISVNAITASGELRVSLPAGAVRDLRGNLNSTSISDDNVVTVNVPVSANLSGRVNDSFGRGLSRSVLTLTLPDGGAIYTQTNPLGYYRFLNTPTGAVSLSVERKNKSTSSTSFVFVQDTPNFNVVLQSPAPVPNP